MSGLLGIMKQKTLQTKQPKPLDATIVDPAPKPGLLKKKPAFKVPTSPSGLMQRLTGK